MADLLAFLVACLGMAASTAACWGGYACWVVWRDGRAADRERAANTTITHR